MNNIPEDLVEHIISFACDRRGYNTIEYYKRKKENEKRMERIRTELVHWSGVTSDMGRDNGRSSVCWLKSTKSQSSRYYLFKRSLKDGNPQVCYHIGCYLSEDHEINAMTERDRLLNTIG